MPAFMLSEDGGAPVPLKAMPEELAARVRKRVQQAALDAGQPLELSVAPRPPAGPLRRLDLTPGPGAPEEAARWLRERQALSPRGALLITLAARKGA
jgi:hypothetical protein